MVFISETAKYLPANEIFNEDLIQFPERYRQLIEEKAGIKARRHVIDECTSDIGAAAVRRLLDKIDVLPSEIDALICATSSPDRIQPATATRIQELCGLHESFAFDVNSACSGGLFALKIAASFVECGMKNVIVVASEALSKLLNPKDISTFPYFGDGAAAVLISKKGNYELKDFLLFSDGSGSDTIQIPAGGTILPAAEVENNKDYYFCMNGRKVFDFACTKGSEIIQMLEERNGIRPGKIITHQANINIIKTISSITRLPYEDFFVNVDKYANTAGASAFIALDEYLSSDPDQDDVFLVTFGGGLSWGGCYLKKRN